MKILLLQDDIYLPSYAGGLKANRKLMEAFVRDGHQSAVMSPALTRSSDGPSTPRAFVREMASRGISVHSSGPDVSSYSYLGVQVDALNHPAVDRSAEFVVRRIREFQPDWVLVTEDKHRFLLECALCEAADRVVLLLQTITQLPFGPLAVQPSQKQSELVGAVRAIIVISDYLARYVREHRAVECCVMQPPVYGDGPFPILGRADSGFITMINPCDLKGLPIFASLARAFSRLTFAAVPTWGAEDAVLRTLHQLPNVHILEPADEIEEILAQTRVLLVPSLWPESFGYVATEAMLRGVPVLASDVGGLPEAKLGVDYVLPVTPAKRINSKYVFPPQNVEPWIRALSEITGDANAYQRCSTASRAAALKHTSSISAASFERFFNGLGSS